MALFRVTLDGNLLADEPEGLMDFVSELKRDKAIGGQVLLVDLTIKFKDGTDGYAHLKPLIDCQGFCASSEIQIDEDCNEDNNWVQIFDGLIFYTVIKEHLFPCILECLLTDNSFFAKIDNNKNVEAFVNIGRSKNDVTIASASTSSVHFFDVVTGNYDTSHSCFRVWWAFRFIIQYMTDGEMDFISDYFGTGGEAEGMAITTGELIRIPIGGAATKFPFISFQKLFEEVNKKTPIAFSIETIAGVKTMRIEPRSYFYNTGISTTINNVKGIIKSVNTSELYSRLKIGSSETIEYSLGLTDFPTDIRFAGFKEESYTLTGKCNIDNTLDLVSDWIIDSNVIQDVHTNGNTGYDEDIFFIMFDPSTLQATQTDVFNTGGAPLFYNDFLRNVNVALRWLGNIPNSIALYLGSGNDEFQAEGHLQTIPPGIPLAPPTSGFIQPLDFEDDFNAPNFDTNGNYNTILFRYTAPASGLFTLFSSIPFKIFPFGPDGYRIRAYFQRYDSADTLIDSFEFATTGFVFPTVPDEINITLSGSRLIYLNSTDYAVVAYKAQRAVLTPAPTGKYFLMPGRIFSCVSALTGGGVFQTYNPEDFKAYQYEIKDFPLTFADYQTIIANPLKLLAFNDGTNDYDGWIENMKYHHIKGTADFVLSKSLTKTTCE